MDAFTQRLMDRAKSRREALEKKISEQALPRKRPMPLTDNNEIFTDSSSVCSLDDESPKRQCVRSAELMVKTDTPAIQSVRARRNALAPSLLERGTNDVVPIQRNMDDEEENIAPAPSATTRRNRFAALASTINDWEDDLTHVKSKQEEKPKKVWTMPNTTPPETASNNSQLSNKTSSANKDGPSKPVRTFEHETHSSGSHQKTVVSSTTFKLGRAEPDQILIVPGVTTAISPSIPSNRIDIVQGTTTTVSPSIRKIGEVTNRSPQPFKSSITVSATSTKPPTTASVKSPRKAVNMRQEDTASKGEPTVRPVSVRMAEWQEKTGATPAKDSEPTKLPVASRKGLWEQKINDAEKEKKPTSPIKPGMRPPPKATTSAVVMREKASRLAQQEPTDETVHTRMSLWEKRVSKNSGSSPTKQPQPVSALAATAAQAANETRTHRTSPFKSTSSNVLSPEKIGQATKSLADRLNTMQNGWQNNEIAEKIKGQKDQELAMLRNRWKNGIASDDQHHEAVSTDIPVAPPLQAVKESHRSPKKNGPLLGKCTEARKVARTEGEDNQADISELTNPENFECKLRAMGFDVTSENEGKVAVADLAPIKEKEKREATKPSHSPKVAKMQLKVLNVEDTRTTTTRFGDNKVTMTVKTTDQNACTRAQQGGKTSIYQLIKKKVTTNDTIKDPTVKLQYDDSFESGDSFMEDDEEELEEELEEEAAVKVQVTTSTHHTASANGRMVPAVSQESMYSETSENSAYTEGTEGEYTEEEDYSEGEEELEDEDDVSDDGVADGNVDDLLDEVMDDTVTTETETTEGESDTTSYTPVAAPRKSPQKQMSSRQKSQRSLSNNSATNFRVPMKQPPRRHDNRVTFACDVRGGITSSSSQYTGSSTSTASSGGSSASESEEERAYTIDLYRKSNRDRPCSVPSMTIVRQSEHTKRMSVPDDPLPFIPEKSVRQQLRDLQNSVNQEQSVIQQTSNALNQCCGSNSNFANSVEAVECHRLLLVSCKKRESYLNEMERLRSAHVNKAAGPRGSLTISDIRLPLKKEFVNKIASPDTAQHFFICLLRNGAHTIVSQMVSTHDAAVRDTLDIPNMFKLSEIGQDFRYDLEVYSMSISREPQVSTPKKKAKCATPKKGLFGHLKPGTPRSMQSPGGPNVVRSSNFMRIANLPISIKSINTTHFTLDGVPYVSPLQGTIHIRLQCLMESAVEEKGFLTMFEDVGGFGAWHRRWCVLRNNTLSYWKYPDDENIKDPIGLVELKTCITDKVGLIPRDICARPNTFEIVTVRRQHRGDSNTLVTRCANTMTTTRHQLSADTKEDRLVWCEALNKALATLRAWSSDAMRPIKVIRPDYAETMRDCVKSVNHKKPLTHLASADRC